MMLRKIVKEHSINFHTILVHEYRMVLREGSLFTVLEEQPDQVTLQFLEPAGSKLCTTLSLGDNANVHYFPPGSVIHLMPTEIDLKKLTLEDYDLYKHLIYGKRLGDS